jgi:hypothetical protein
VQVPLKNNAIILGIRLMERRNHMELINCTPHPINLLDGDGNSIRTLLSSGIVVRIQTETVNVTEYLGVQIIGRRYTSVSGLPAPKYETYYIVSLPIASHLKDIREDLLVPNDLVRDEKGTVIGCRNFAKVIP